MDNVYTVRRVASFTAANDAITVENPIIGPLGTEPSYPTVSAQVLQSVKFRLGGTFVGAVVLEETMDGTNWTAVGVFDTTSTIALGAASVAAAGTYGASGLGQAARMRIRCSAYTSGTIEVVAVWSSDPLAGLYAAGTQSVGGTMAHDGVMSGSPVPIALRALSTNPTAVASADSTYATATLDGILITKDFSVPDLDWSYTSLSVTTGSDQAVKAAAGAGIRNYLTGFTISNGNATPSAVTIKDGTTAIWQFTAPASMPLTAVQFLTPIKTTANTALNINVTSAAAIAFNAQGYSAR